MKLSKMVADKVAETKEEIEGSEETTETETGEKVDADTQKEIDALVSVGDPQKTSFGSNNSTESADSDDEVDEETQKELDAIKSIAGI